MKQKGFTFLQGKKAKTLLRFKNSGFTLVELLIVIIIISILATIGLTMYSSAQKSARVAKRLEDLRSLKNSLEVYYSVNKAYPTTSGAWRSTCTQSPVNDVIPGLTPKYMNAIPQDPSYNSTSNTTSCYLYKSDGIDYKLYDTSPDMASADYQTQTALLDPNRDGSNAGVNACLVDGTTFSAWAIWSSCDSSSTACGTSGSCWW